MRRTGLMFGALFLTATLATLASERRAAGQPPERPRPMQELLKKYDADGNGQLSRTEREALRQDAIDGKLDVPAPLRERIINGPQPGQGGPGIGARGGQSKGGQGGLRLPENVTVERDVEYARVGDKPLLLDIVRPKQPADKGPLPWVIFVHGGGWQNGDKAGGAARVAPLVATGNYVGATINYRLSGEASFPAQIFDCKAAIRFLRANAAKYGADPARIAVMGTSAGGHLVSLLGTSGDAAALEGDVGTTGVSSRVQAVVDMCGPSDFYSFIHSSPQGHNLPRDRAAAEGRDDPREKLLGGPLEERLEVARAASPVTHATADDPPFLIMHGTEDHTVPISQAEAMKAALDKAGVQNLFVKIEGGEHSFGGPEVNQRIQDFLDHYLRGEKIEVSSAPIVQQTTPRMQRPAGNRPRPGGNNPRPAANGQRPAVIRPESADNLPTPAADTAKPVAE